MKPKNTICLWFNKDAHEAARFYAATFPNSTVTAVHGGADVETTGPGVRLRYVEAGHSPRTSPTTDQASL